MAIDLKTEQVIAVRGQAAAYLGPGRNGRPVHVSFLIRAITRGINGHRLEALKVGSRWITTVEALQRWAESQTPGLEPKAVGPEAPSRLRKAAEEAEAELDRLGL